MIGSYVLASATPPPLPTVNSVESCPCPTGPPQPAGVCSRGKSGRCLASPDWGGTGEAGRTAWIQHGQEKHYFETQALTRYHWTLRSPSLACLNIEPRTDSAGVLSTPSVIHIQGRRHQVLTSGDGFSCVKTTYPEILISPRISVSSF